MFVVKIRMQCIVLTLYSIASLPLQWSVSQWIYQDSCSFIIYIIMQSTIMSECVLCASECEFVGVAECNHEPFCYRCIYKMRVISKNNLCPICKFQSKNIIIAKNFKPYEQFKGQLLYDQTYGDILYAEKQAKMAFEKLTEFKCFMKIGGKPCKNQKKFVSIAFLKKHLKEEHNRYVCEICFEKKTCVLEQQKLYSQQALNRHMQKGDLDESGNVTFMHPHCKFCNRYFFDDDQFKMHMNVEHIICTICGPEFKYVYYKKYDNLEIHYKISHYMCSQNQCLNNKFIAFKSAEELRIHRLQVHDKSSNKKVDLREMCGFKSEGQQQINQLTDIKDKEGVDMQNQFLSLKKTKNRALAEADKQIDLPLDIRQFYQCNIDENQHFQTAFILKHHRKESEEVKTVNKKKKYIEKSQIEKQKPAIAKQNQKFFIEDIRMLRTINLPRLPYQQFQSNLKRILKEDQLQRFNEVRSKVSKGKSKPQEIIDTFFQIMVNVSLKSAYQIFPHFIRTIINQQIKQILDLQFLKRLKKIPSETNDLLLVTQDYSNLFDFLIKELEKNIEKRIVDRSISIKKPIVRCRERLYQLMGVVRRLKIEEMAKLKFSSNFGLQKDTIDFIYSNILKMKVEGIQNRLIKINSEELIDFYVFIKYCSQAIKHSKGMQLEKNKIHDDILEDFLYQRPYLEKQYGKKKNQLSFEEQVEFEKEEQERRRKKQLKEIEVQNKKRGYNTQTDFNLVDKSDFPELMEKKQLKEQKSQEVFKEVIRDIKEKPATYQKKINQMFPTLGEDNSPKKEENGSKQVKKEKAWWEKLNNDRPLQEDIEVVQVTKKGKKKKVQWVQVKGIFN